MSRIDGFEAHAINRFDFGDLVELFMWRRGTEGQRVAITQLATEPNGAAEVASVPIGAMSPALYLPRPFAEPLRDALDELLGRPHDDYRARYEETREALAAERARVNLLLDVALNVRA